VIRESPLALADLSRWDECFITSTSRHVMPVTSVDGRPVGAGQVGPMTRRLAAIFEEDFQRRIAEGRAGPRRPELIRSR
jgi:branched-subunit amino acid aminotransferase/4-amino-4-deoxychorismate lyase